MKLVAVGIDGGSFDFVCRNLNSLPFFRRLYEEKALKSLKSVFPPITWPAWMSISTGKDVKDHKYFSFVYLDRNYKIRLLPRKKIKKLWDILSQKRKKIIMVNIPLTFPPPRVNGIVVSGMDTPKEAKIFTHPQDLSRKLRKMGYIIEPYISKNKSILFKTLLFSLSKRLKVFNYLMECADFDFFLGFKKPSSISNEFTFTLVSIVPNP